MEYQGIKQSDLVMLAKRKGIEYKNLENLSNSKLQSLISENRKLLFSDKNKLIDKYYEWIKQYELEHETKIQDCPLNIISWLQSIGCLNNIKIRELLRKDKINEETKDNKHDYVICRSIDNNYIYRKICEDNKFIEYRLNGSTPDNDLFEKFCFANFDNDKNNEFSVKVLNDDDAVNFVKEWR